MNKFFLKSKTIMGALVTLAPTIAVLFGYTLTEDDSAMITQTADAIIQLIGAALVVYGRVTAKEKLYV
ncbi:hypothetical protein OAO65_02205 [Flavobacteriales bacterium]|nr:hypothetical protein [Flavobacteriales bacterium]